MSSPITQEAFAGFAFPVVRVKYAGPTNSRGSRWIASCRIDNERTVRCTLPYRHEVASGSVNALPAAVECMQRAFAAGSGGWEHPQVADYVAIPGDLSASEYSFTFVPAYFFNRSES